MESRNSFVYDFLMISPKKATRILKRRILLVVREDKKISVRRIAIIEQDSEKYRKWRVALQLIVLKIVVSREAKKRKSVPTLRNA